jgi:hypothetical protein
MQTRKMPHMIRKFLTFILIIFALSTQANADFVQVDKKIVILIDTSGSMNPLKFRWQLNGYADALLQPEISQAIDQGHFKKIAVAVIQFSSNTYLSIDWTIIDTTNIHHFSDQVRNIIREQNRMTGLGLGLNHAREMIQDTKIQSTQTIILVSGDGKNNISIPAWPLSEEISTFLKVTIVGVIIPGEWNLKEFFEQKVIAGPGKFLVEANSSEDFTQALIQLFRLNER